MSRLITAAVAPVLLVALGLAAGRSTHTSVAAAAGPAPVRAAFYYPWFPETEHWGTHYSPTLGKYDSSSTKVIATHIAQAQYAGLDAFISSWWGRGTPTDQRLPMLLNAATAKGFHIAPYYEPEGSGNPSAAALKGDLDRFAQLAAQYGDAWLKVGGKPVVFVYNADDSTCAVADRWASANAGRFHVVLKVFPGYTACAQQPGSWHQYGPATGYSPQLPYSATVSPGFYKFSESTPRLVRSVSRFRADLARQVASKAQWQLITTFNEWGEGSSVEPATTWSSSSGNGAYLDAMRAVYGSTSTPPTTAPPTTAPPTTAPPTTPTTPTPPGGKITKVLTFVEENHSLSQMRSGMPNLYKLATQYGYATNYTAITHPSLPNYLAMGSGSTSGVTNDANPSSHPLSGRTVFGAALQAGRTAKSYQESMTSNCRGTSSGRYAPKHNFWAYYTDERASCQALDVPSGTSKAGALHTDLANGLPDVAVVTPNLDNDAHDGSLGTADSWLGEWLRQAFAGPDWKAGRLAIVVTADEDDGHQGNTVLTVVMHPSLSHKVVTTALTHYSWTGMMTELTGAACLRAGCSAPNMASAFGLAL